MADASIIDIGGVQWNIKDRESRERITTLEEKTSANFDYTLDEKEIGTWIDGKKLYRLIVQGSMTTGRAKVSLSDRKIDTLTVLNGVFKDSEGTIYPQTYYFADTTSDIGKNYIITYYSRLEDSLFLGVGNANYFSNVSFIIQIEYTKNE